MESGKDHELESLAHRWEKVVLDQGHTAILSIFPRGEFSIGAQKIKGRKSRKEWELRAVYRSKNEPVPLEGTLGYISNVINRTMFERRKDEWDAKPPEGIDILAISDLNKDRSRIPKGVFYYEENLEAVMEKMFGVLYESHLESEPGIQVLQIMLLPKSLFKEFVNDSLRNPKLGKSLADKLFSGIDEVLPRKRPESLLFFVNNKLKFKSRRDVPNFKVFVR